MGQNFRLSGLTQYLASFNHEKTVDQMNEMNFEVLL